MRIQAEGPKSKSKTIGGKERRRGIAPARGSGPPSTWVDVVMAGEVVHRIALGDERSPRIDIVGMSAVERQSMVAGQIANVVEVTLVAHQAR